MEATETQTELDLGDPRPLRELHLRLLDCGSLVEVRSGGYLITAYPKNDLGLRNLAIVALTESKVSGQYVADLFGLSPVQVSRIRADYRQHGSAGLAKKRGRPALLGDRQIRQARLWAGAGVKHGEIARRLKVSRPLIVALLNEHGPLHPDQPLDSETPWDTGEPTDQPANEIADTLGDHEQPHQHTDQPADTVDDERLDERPDGDVTGVGEHAGGVGDGGRGFDGGPGAVPLTSGTVWSRYAGAMLTHAFTSWIGAQQILTRAVSLPGAGLDGVDLAVLNATRMGFTLGALTIEQAKHLRAEEAGPLTGWSTLPSLRTWRTRLGQIGDRVDPLRLHRDLVTAMLDYAPPARGVVFADDHVVEYTGGQPVGWGRNPRRGKATKAHDDTYICDLAGRALVYATGEPSGLSVTLPRVLTQLSATWPTTNDTATDADVDTDAEADQLRGRRPIVVFDRGAAYPATFTTVYTAGYDFICFRRAPLAAPTHLPVLATIRRVGQDIQIAYTDERVQIDGFAHPLRQITLCENGKPVAQLLSSDLASCPGLLLALLRARWRIENFLKYTAANYGIDTLADYTADYADDTHPVPNPAHATAKKTETAAKTVLATAKTALADLLADPTLDAATKNTRLPAAQAAIHTAEQALIDATAAKKAHRAKIPRNQVDPDAQRAVLRPGRRCLQLTLRLLAANAENDLAHALNTYLHDDDEYRAITRETILRGLGGTIAYSPTTITVTLERPDQPHITRALGQLLHDLNQRPPTIPGDHRPITYHLQTRMITINTT